MANPRTPTERSRYQRVQDILTAAQGQKVPEYDGHHAFWMLPLNEFLDVSIYGQAMIAPADDGGERGQGTSAGCSCGHCHDATDDSTPCWPTGSAGTGRPAGSSRSDRSGLIVGLRGDAPFDDSTFPKLLWQASHNVSAADIALIADWIDAGCPKADHVDGQEDAAVTVRQEMSLRRAHGDEPYPQSTRHPSEDRDAVGGPRIRKDIESMSESELELLREAISCMRTLNEFWQDERSYNFWARIHTNSCQHGWEQFLPWHRLYLYFFEQALEDYDPRITLPYWNWAALARQNRTSDETKDLDLGVIPEAFQCWIDEAAADKLAHDESTLFTRRQLSELEKLGKQKARFSSGLRFLTAAGVEYEYDTNTGWSPRVKAIYDELARINSLWIPQRWPGAIGHAVHYPTSDDMDVILSMTPFNAFGSGPVNDHHYGALESTHNGMHNFAGGANPKFNTPGNPQEPDNPQYGLMVDNRVTAFDPIFWAHHSNVDRLWTLWQEEHPGANPLDLDDVLPPWSMTVKDTLSVKTLGYEYQKAVHFFPTDPNVGVVRFSSEHANVKPRVLSSHRKAEVRIHRIQRGDKENVTIRVFLNKSDADAATKVSDRHFAGQVTTFHGSCYGGPGHCAVPPPRTRMHDRRPLHHHEPRNFRIDVTDTVQRLVAKGAKDISVHLIVIGIDGRPLDNALFIDGVSLNFFD